MWNTDTGESTNTLAGWQWEVHGKRGRGFGDAYESLGMPAPFVQILGHLGALPTGKNTKTG